MCTCDATTVLSIFADFKECGSLLDVSDRRICHLPGASYHFCVTKPIRVNYRPTRMPRPEEAITFVSCDAEIEHAGVRALCQASRPIIEANEHVVWASDVSDTENSSYLLFFEVSAFELFVFPVDGDVLNCISDYHRWLRRAVFCFILEAGTGTVALYRYIYTVSDGWFESDSFPGFVSDRTILSSSFVLEHCPLTTPFVIVGTTLGVKSIKISHNDPSMHPFTDLQAVKLLRHLWCKSMLYILTLDGVQVYNVKGLQAEPLQPMNWSVAELSLDGTRIAFAGSHHDQSCWMQVWNTANQDVVLNVTRDDCNIASIAVSQMHVCYHMANITGQEWKLACLELGRKNVEVVLANGHHWGLKDRLLTLDGNVLVERIWDAINLYQVPEKTILHKCKSKHPTVAYLPGTSGAQDNRCRIPSSSAVHPSPTMQHPSTPNTTYLSESATPTEQPTTGSKPTIQSSLLVVLSGCTVGVVLFICAVASIGVITALCMRTGCMHSKWYQTNEAHPSNLRNIVDSSQNLTQSESKDCFDV